MGSEQSEPVLIDRREGIAYLTLNRPEAGNAIDVNLAQGLLEAVISVEADPQVQCVVLRAQGRMFSVGGDINALHQAGDALPDVLTQILHSLHPAIFRLATMAKPLITAVHAPAAGGGIGLAVVGDIVLAEPSAHFTMAYSKIGLTPDAGATWLLPRLVGHRRSQELMLTNRRLSAQDAADIGLITRVVGEGALGHEVDAVARSILAGAAASAVGVIKQLLVGDDAAALQRHLDAEKAAIVSQGYLGDCKAAIAAFLGGRKSA